MEMKALVSEVGTRVTFWVNICLGNNTYYLTIAYMPGEHDKRMLVQLTLASLTAPSSAGIGMNRCCSRVNLRNQYRVTLCYAC